MPYANSIQLTEHVEHFDKQILPKSTMANQHFRGHGNITASIQESPYTLEDRASSRQKAKKISTSQSLNKLNNVNDFWGQVERTKKSLLERQLQAVSNQRLQ